MNGLLYRCLLLVGVEDDRLVGTVPSPHTLHGERRGHFLVYLIRQSLGLRHTQALPLVPQTAESQTQAHTQTEDRSWTLREYTLPTPRGHHLRDNHVTRYHRTVKKENDMMGMLT
jgi:hypothetical protein